MAAIVLAAQLWAGTALGRDCGGGIFCACGDTVTADYTLTADLGPCEEHGLLVASDVVLDGGGHEVSGTSSGEAVYGIYVRNAEGSVVRNIRASGFRHGLRLRAAHGNQVLDSEFHDNGAQGLGYGMDLALASSNNLLRGNRVHDNADEGVHFGPGCNGNDFEQNLVYDNASENVYLLAVHNHTIRGNTLFGGRDGFFVKDSFQNVFEDNVVRDGAVVLRGDTWANVLRGNQIEDAGVRIQVYDQDVSPRFPHSNEIEGGSITHDGTCLRFESSSQNVVRETALSGCKTEVRSDADVGPAENTVVGIDLRPQRLNLDAASLLRQSWRLGVRVEHSGGGPVADARVTARDGAGVLLFEETTGASGTLPARDLLAAVYSGGGVATFTPFSFTVEVEEIPPVVRRLVPSQSGTVLVSVDALLPTNEPPVARIDGATAGFVGVPLEVSATGSFDPDGDPLGFSWDFGDGSAPATGLNVSHTFASPGAYVVVVAVDDGQATSSATLDVEIRVPDPLNLEPVVDAGENQKVEAGEVVQLDGVASDDGRPLNPGSLQARWAVISSGKAVRIDDESAPATTAIFDAPGTYVLRLEADDGELVGSGQTIVTVVRPSQSDILYNDFAITKLKFSKRAMLTDVRRESRVKGTIEVQNQGETAVAIDSRQTLVEFLDLTIESLGACPDPAVLLEPKVVAYPVILSPRAKLAVNVSAFIDCANDGERTSGTNPGHEDYRVKLRIDREVVDGFVDDDPADDACPREVTAPFRADSTWHNGIIRDRGCGSRLPNRTLGGEIHIDVIDRRTGS